jgi:rhodanese-related sulfurtransferase
VQLINREKAVVVDVCEADEFAAGHVGGAKNIPLGQLEERLAGAGQEQGNPLILVCAKGRAVGPCGGHRQEAGLREGPVPGRWPGRLESEPAGWKKS